MAVRPPLPHLTPDGGGSLGLMCNCRYAVSGFGGSQGGTMGRQLLELIGYAAISLLWLAGTGCSSSAVGDPCVPEQVPRSSPDQPPGFLAAETYLEISAVQCATRVCLVRNLDGDPTNLQEDECPRGEDTCVSTEEVERRVYCSCRCAAPAGSDLPTCSCPDGFLCEEVLETGGDGIRGSYCVRDPFADTESM